MGLDQIYILYFIMSNIQCETWIVFLFIPAAYEGFKLCSYVYTKGDAREVYHGFCKHHLWSLFHSMAPMFHIHDILVQDEGNH